MANIENNFSVLSFNNGPESYEHADKHQLSPGDLTDPGGR